MNRLPQHRRGEKASGESGAFGDCVATLFRGGLAWAGSIHSKLSMEIDQKTSDPGPYSTGLLDAVLVDVPAWIISRVEEALTRSRTGDHDAVRSRLAEIVERTTDQVRRELGGLLSTDVDEQRSNPLHVLRAATSHATAILREAGIEPARRDEFDASVMPDDLYALGPLTWRDVSEDVHEAGISWGAWKAATVLDRRRREGKLD